MKQVNVLWCLVVYLFPKPVYSYVEFPNHPKKRRRSACGATLMKKVKYGAAYKLVPVKMFLYNSVIEALKGIIRRNGFLQQCNAWKEYAQSGGMLSDIMDGRVWKQFRFYNNRPFLDAPNNLCFALNIDWFNP